MFDAKKQRMIRIYASSPRSPLTVQLRAGVLCALRKPRLHRLGLRTCTVIVIAPRLSMLDRGAG